MADIRKYFGGGGASSGKKANDDDKPPTKKPKTTDAPAPSAAAKSPKKTTPRPAAAKTVAPSSSGKRQKTASGGVKPAAATAEKKKKIEEDDGDVINLADSDFEIDLEESSDDGGDADYDLASEDEEMKEAVQPKKRKAPSASPAAPKAAKAAAPAKRKSAARKSKLPAALAAIEHDPVAMAAVAAVDAAAEKLPPEEELGMTLLSEATYGGRAPDEPPFAGQREAPRGHPDCLTGKTFVVSGVLDSLTRGEAEDFIRRHGGKVTGSVSGRTSFLVVGQHTGRTKYHTAKTNGTKMINEAGLFALVAAAPPPKEEVAAAAAPPQQQQQQQVPAARPTSFQGGAGTSAGTSSSRPAPAARPSNPDSQLWVEKWRPKTSAELVGNQSTVGLLRHWLQSWERVHLKGEQPPPLPGARGAKDRTAELKKKAVLLSGSPGIGKTTAALIITRELGYEPVEVNASDTRSKSDASVLKGVAGKLANAVKELTTNAALSYDAQGHRKKLVLIMDEVDGMSAGDRGGVSDLIKTIAKSKVPIIAICNDKYSTKLKSLRNHCMELDFRKPMVNQISKRMLEIAHAEGLSMNQATMDALVQSSSGGDIRLILGQLQMLRLRSRAVSFDQIKSGGAGTAKDAEMSPFEAARRLLDSDAASLSMSDQIELVFQDADLVPLLVQENYLNHRPSIASDEEKRLKVISKAAEGFSAGDVANRSVRQYQNWALMPFAAAMSTVNPASYCRGPRETFGLFPGEMNFPRFSAWLGQNSSSRKQQRLLGEMHTRMLSSGALECDRTALRLSYMPVLRQSLTKPLREDGKEGIPEVLTMMNDYCLAREDIDYIVDVTKFKTKEGWGEDPFKPIDTAVKSAFTRAFNSQHLKPKTGFGMEDGKKKRGGKGRGAAAADDEDEEEGGMMGEGGEGEGVKKEEEEEEELDPVALQRKLMGMKHKGMEVTLKDGSKAKTGTGGRGRGRGRGAGTSKAAGRGGGRGRGKK